MAGMYSAKVMEHFAHPHNVGEIPDANGVGEVGNPKCGDIMRMYLKIENNVIVDVKFLTFGCGAAIATSRRYCFRTVASRKCLSSRNFPGGKTIIKSFTSI